MFYCGKLNTIITIAIYEPMPFLIEDQRLQVVKNIYLLFLQCCMWSMSLANTYNYRFLFLLMVFLYGKVTTLCGFFLKSFHACTTYNNLGLQQLYTPPTLSFLYFKIQCFWWGSIWKVLTFCKLWLIMGLGCWWRDNCCIQTFSSWKASSCAWRPMLVLNVTISNATNC